MTKRRTIFKCRECGFETVKWVGKCPQCDQWNTIEEVLVDARKTSISGSNRVTARKPTQRLIEVASNKGDRIVTGIGEFNRVMGGGIVKDSITIISAKPGAGKSTLLLQVAQDVASYGLKVLYASGEESESQIRNRADRIWGLLMTTYG